MFPIFSKCPALAESVSSFSINALFNLDIIKWQGKRWRSSSNDSEAIVMSVTYSR
jgi:hypothetical protein